MNKFRQQEANSYIRWPNYVRGPLLFVIFINDIGDEILSTISKFVDTKLSTTVADEEVEILQDLRRMLKRSKDWLMIFNLKSAK